MKTMTDRDRLIELLHKAEDICDSTLDCDTCKYVLSGSCKTVLIADYLLANDFTKVVRCEKCKFACFQYNTDKYPFGLYACKKQPTGRAYKKVKGNHFCSYGELKERDE